MTSSDYAKHLATRIPVVTLDGAPWCVRHRRLMPVTPPHLTRPVDPDLVRRAMRETGCFAAMWNDAWDTAPCRWWWVCCDSKDYDMETFRKNRRRDVRKGLEACEVRRVAPEFFAEHGYPVFVAAHAGYGAAAPLTAQGFAAEVLANAEYPGRETWGAFVEGELVAYESCVVVDDAALSMSAKSDPEHHQAHPNNALVYTLTRHYLVERGLSYASAGARSLSHDTHVQDFQLRMGYRLVYCPLRALFSPLVRMATALGVHRWGKYVGLGRLAGGRMEALRAAALAADIARDPDPPAEADPAPDDGQAPRDDAQSGS